MTQEQAFEALHAYEWLPKLPKASDGTHLVWHMYEEKGGLCFQPERWDPVGLTVVDAKWADPQTGGSGNR